jgi:hypothetical protein
MLSSVAFNLFPHSDKESIGEADTISVDDGIYYLREFIQQNCTQPIIDFTKLNGSDFDDDFDDEDYNATTSTITTTGHN